MSRRRVLGAAIASMLPVWPCWSHALSGDDPRAVRSRSALAERFAANVEAIGLPGAAATLVGPAATPCTLSHGYASLPFCVPVNSGTLFHAGSVGKHVTAVAVLRCVDAGRVDLHAGIGRYVAEVPAAWRAAPVATLLSHTSGIPDYPDGITWDRPLPRTLFFAGAGDRPLDFAPGTARWYCNAAYTLLGYLLEDVNGCPYAESIADVFRRAGLRDARVDAAESVIPRRAEPYERDGQGGWRHATPMSDTISSVAAGGILMSPRDVVAWEAALADAALLSPESRRSMESPFRLSTGYLSPYNMGWMIDELPARRRILWHTGSVSGFRCFHFRCPSSGVAAMFFANGGDEGLASLALELIEAFSPGSTPLPLKSIRDDAPDLTRAALEMLTGAGELDPARFAPEMRTLIARFGTDAVERFDTRAEPLHDFALVQLDHHDLGFRRRYRLSLGTRRIFVSIDYSAAGQIQDIQSL